LVRDDDHVAKLKLHVPTFDGRYNPDAYLSWELELDQRFACLNSVEDYYQELQTGMLCCGIEEDNEALMAHFVGGLNKEIQTILRYKSYHTITCLFHLACNAECEVHDRREATRTNFSAGRSSWRSPN
jgi:hypothetical protein